MNSSHVSRHISGSSFKSDSVLAFITLSSLLIFFSFSSEEILSFSFDSNADIDVALHLGTIFTLFGFCEGIFHFSGVNLKNCDAFGVFQTARPNYNQKMKSAALGGFDQFEIVVVDLSDENCSHQ